MDSNIDILQEKGFLLNNGWKIILFFYEVEKSARHSYQEAVRTFYDNNFDNLLEDYKAFADVINQFGVLPNNTCVRAAEITLTLMNTTFETDEKIMVLQVK